MKKIDNEWYFMNSSSQVENIKHTNWDPNKCTSKDCGPKNLGCPFMQTNGYWAFGMSMGTCSTLELCTVCSFEETPVFTLKGLCTQDSQLDWNYFLMINSTNQIAGYDGYKSSRLKLDGGIWKLYDIGVSSEIKSDNPLGRKEWNYIDHTCSMSSESKNCN